MFFSPSRVRELVEEVVQQKQPKFSIDFDSARLELAGEWWPSIAVELSGIKIKAKEPCITNSSLLVDKLTLPLELSTLFRKKIRLGHVRAGYVRIFYRNTSCERPLNFGDTLETDDFAPLERFFQKRWSKELINTARFLNEFSVETLEILRDDQILSPAKLEQISMTFSPEQGVSEIKFAVHLGEPWVGEAAFGLMQTDVVIRADEVRLTGRGNLKEGQIHILGQWAIDRGEATLNLSTQDVPASSVLGLAHHWKILNSFSPNLKNQWASCDMSISGEVRKIQNLELNLHQCRLYGDYGEIVLKTTHLLSLAEGGELVFQLQDVDVKSALSAFDFAKNWGLVSQFGRFSGEMTIGGRNTYSLKGVLNGLEFYISRLKTHARQKINSFQLDLAMLDERFSGRAYDFSLDMGELAGGISFNFSPAGEGLFQLAQEKIVLSDEVEIALWGGTVSEFAIFGQGSVKNSELERFSGSLAMADLKTTDWRLKNIKANINFQNKLWNMTSLADELRIFPESKWSEAAQILGGLSFSFEHEPTFVKLSANIHLGQGGGSWKDFSASVPSQSVKWVSAGEWSTKDGIRGYLSASDKNQDKSWSIEGSWQEPRLKVSGSP